MARLIALPLMPLVSLMLFAQVAGAARYSELLVNWRKGEDISCSALPPASIEPLAMSGDIDAQVYMAWASAEGMCGIAESDYAARDWAQKAADQGDAEAELAVGYYYYWGLKPIRLPGDTTIDVGGGMNNVGKDKEQAIAWTIKSANHGYGPALAVAGRFYNNGYIPTGGSKEAYRVYTMAVSSGYLDACTGAAMVLFGSVQTTKVMGDAESFAEGAELAYYYFALGERLGGSFPTRLRHVAIVNKDRVASSKSTLKRWMSEEQIAKAEARVLETLSN